MCVMGGGGTALTILSLKQKLQFGGIRNIVTKKIINKNKVIEQIKQFWNVKMWRVLDHNHMPNVPIYVYYNRRTFKTNCKEALLKLH